jgi:hypothetical protein
MGSVTGEYQGPKDAAIAFENTDWKRILPELQRYAKSCLSFQGFHERPNRTSMAIESQELINQAVLALLAGERTWVPAQAKTEAGLVAVICMTMKSICANVRGRAAFKLRARSDKAERHISRTMDETPDAEEQLVSHEWVGEVKEAIAGDAEIVRLVDTYADGKVRHDEVAKALDWTVPKVKVTQKRMRRLLRSKGIALRDTSEDAATERNES